MLLTDNGVSLDLTQWEYQLLTRARMIHLCDECSINDLDENVFHINPEYSWADVDETLSGEYWNIDESIVTGDGLQCESTHRYLWYLNYKQCCSEVGIQPMTFATWIEAVHTGFPK